MDKQQARGSSDGRRRALARLGLWVGLGLGAGCATTADQPSQLSLDEVKRQFHTDWVSMSEQIPLFSYGRYGTAYEQLKQANERTTSEVMKLVAEKDRQAALTQQLQAELSRGGRQYEILEAERRWFERHAVDGMRRVEGYQRIFRHPVLDETAAYFVGSPLVARGAGIDVAKGTLLVNFGVPVRHLQEASKLASINLSLKLARLLCAPLAQPEAVSFVVLRRLPGSAEAPPVFEVAHFAAPAKATVLKTFENGRWLLYEWELQTVLRARSGDCLGVLFDTPATVAGDFAGVGRFGTLARSAPRIGEKVSYDQFAILAGDNELGLDESFAGSLGFLGWTAE